MRARASLSKARKPVRRVSAERHNAVLEAAQARVDALEGRLAHVVEGVIDRAGVRAAHRFELKATNHLTAAAGNADVAATATMICLRPRPDEADAIADPDGDAPETLHVTLAYLGKTDQPLAEIAEALQPVAASLAPLEGAVGGYGVFDPPGVGILLPDVRGLVELRVAVTEALLEARIDYGRQHGFEAHITVHSDPTSDDQSAALERAAQKPLHFDALHVVRGNAEEVVIPLVGVPSLTAAGEPPAWSAPFPDEVIDVQKLVAELLAKTDPVRKAMIEQTMTSALEQAGLSWDVTNPLTAKVLAQSASQIASIAETTQLNVMRIIQSAYQNGLTIPQTATAIRAGMKVASKTRATLIARTELAGAANGGSLAATQLVAGATGQNYSKSWRTAPGAKYPRHEEYDGLDGQTVALDQMFEVGIDELQFPGDPNGDPGEVCNCRCEAPWNRVSARPLAAARRPYEGHLVRLTTAAGREIAVTPNHPILTRHGWVAAGLLQEGDDIVCCSRLDFVTGCPDVDDVPSQAEERFAALQFAAARRERVMGRSVNLHGEIPVGEVEVVWADDSLALEDESALGEKLRELALSLAHREVSLHTDSSALFGGPETQPVRYGDSPTFDACSSEDDRDRSATNREPSREGEFALASAVGSDDLRCDRGVSVLGSLPLPFREIAADPPSSEMVPDGHRREAALVADLLVAHPALVKLDPVVDCRRFDYAGYVYTFSTLTGAYLTEGIVSANCTLTYGPPLGEDEAAAISPVLDSADDVLAELGVTDAAGAAVEMSEPARTVAEIVPGTPEMTLESVDRTIESRIGAYAQKHGITEDEYRAAALDSIKRGVADAQVGIRIAPAETVLGSGGIPRGGRLR